MSVNEIFTKDLLENDAFRKDIAKLFSLDAHHLELLRANLPETPAQLRDKEFVEKAANIAELTVDDYLDVAPISKMLIVGVSVGKTSVEDLLNFCSENFGIELNQERSESFRGFFSTRKAEKDEVDEVNAFSFGDTFASFEFKQLITPDKTSDQLWFGGSLKIEYIGEDGLQKSLALNISLPELKSLVDGLRKDLDGLERIKEKMMGVA